MSDRSAIEWTDATWNPVTGCTKVSPGCDHCYAETFAERFRGVSGHPYEHGFDLALRPERLAQVLRWRRPRRIFVNSMSDLFHGYVEDGYVARVFAVMALARWHTFQVLTKRHARMRSLVSNPEFWMEVAGQLPQFDPGSDAVVFYPLPNVWLGVSVEDQHWADRRIPALLDTPAAVRFLSCEPLLGPVDLTPWLDPPGLCGCLDHEEIPTGSRPTCTLACRQLAGDAALHWVICGGESGPKARPMDPQWVRSLRDQCTAAGVPFLFKQWGGRSSKAGGRELDGRTWDQYPDPHAPLVGGVA